MARVTATVFSSVASISETAIVGHRAKGLCLHEGSRTWGFVGKSITIALKKEPTQLKTMQRKILTTFKPKIVDFALGISFFVQPPSFTTNYLIPTMNS
jgi:hypothetical protein